MKKVLTLLFFASVLLSKAQFTDLKGFTFIAKKILYSEEGNVKSDEVYQVFNFSFKDQLMVHNILGDSKDSQIYKLKNIDKSYNSTTKKTTFKVDAESGVSGSIYKYEININDEGIAEMTLNGYLYTGDSYKLKTYSQE
jgi:hypothetical protein